MKNCLESLEDSNEILIGLKWFLLMKEIKTKFAKILTSKIQIMNEEDVHKNRKLTKEILRRMHATRIKHGRDPCNFSRWRALQY